MHLSKNVSKWHLIYSKIGKEKVALENLEAQGFECFLPTRAKAHSDSAFRSDLPEVLFPRYLFIRLSAELAYSSMELIRSTSGVSRFVVFGQTPVVVNGLLIESIRSLGNSYEVKLNPSQGVCEPRNGALYTAVSELHRVSNSLNRIILLFEIINQDIKLTLAPTVIMKSKV